MIGSALPPQRIAITRALLGLAQGFALYLLYLAYDAKSWPADGGLLFAPLVLIAFFVPLILIQGLGNIRAKTLLLWVGIATLIIGGLAFYDVWHAWPMVFEDGVLQPRILPSPPLGFALLAGAFIAQALVTGGDIERRWMPGYTTHFDVAWKQGLQAALAAAFTGAFWLMLFLAAALFNLIKIDTVEKLLEHKWFAIPATTLAFAAALHITDVRSAIVRGMRTLALTLLSWLLPLMALIAVGFLFAVLFTGVQPLWDTRFATRLLLAAAAALVVLINAAYQDGHEERRAPLLLRYAGTIAAAALVPLAVLAAIALALRVAQYGWTTDRIYAAACVFIACFYAFGYAFAAAFWRREPWLKRVECWNFCGALAVLAVLLLIFSPIIDPYRISVADQVARLESGKVTATQFDVQNLRWNGGRFGQAALERLAGERGNANPGVRGAALAALQQSSEYPGFNIEMGPAEFAAHLSIHTVDGTLPASFTASAAPREVPCLQAVAGADTCDVWTLDIDADGTPEIALGSGSTVWALRENAARKWEVLGRWAFTGCEKLVENARTHGIRTLMPEASLPDLEISGTRTHFRPDSPPLVCPK